MNAMGRILLRNNGRFEREAISAEIAGMQRSQRRQRVGIELNLSFTISAISAISRAHDQPGGGDSVELGFSIVPPEFVVIVPVGVTTVVVDVVVAVASAGNSSSLCSRYTSSNSVASTSWRMR